MPFRRAVSIRVGPQAGAVEQFLRQHDVEMETLADGTNRWRVPVSRIFPDAKPRPVSLTHAFFLNGISARPQATAFEFSSRHLPLLGQLHATFISKFAGERTLTFLNLFRRVRCYKLSPGGTPDQTADLIETIVEGK